jgi:uncharacterized repeat protein (TIGR01451 family)
MIPYFEISIINFKSLIDQNLIKFLSIIFFFTFGNFANAQDATLDWVKCLGNTTDERGQSITVDKLGNVYTTGYFTGTIDFDPGIDTFNLTSATSSTIYVSKLDAQGNFVWAKRMEGTGAGNAIAVDELGNVYTTGYFTGIVDFNPGAGTFNLGAIYTRRIYISKLDAQGNFVWAKNMGGGSLNTYNSGQAIALDSLGNIYTVGKFANAGDFDPGLDTFILNIEGTIYANSCQLFISKLDNQGNFVWAKSLGGVLEGSGIGLALDSAGNIHLGGTIRGVVDFDPGPDTFYIDYALTSTSMSYSTSFVCKLDASGNFVWAKAMGGYSECYSVAVDNNGNVYSTGKFSTTSDFDPGPNIFNLYAINGSLNSRTFISKLDAQGNFIWAKSMGKGFVGGSVTGLTIVVDNFSNCYIVGQYSGLIDFDPGVNVFNLVPPSSVATLFIAKLDNQGNFVWARREGDLYGPITASGNTCVVDHNGTVYVTGYFKGTAYFDLNQTVSHSAYQADIFILKLNQKGIHGKVFQDFNQNCLQETNESGLKNRLLLIQPGNIIVQTNDAGIWNHNSLPSGNYSITIDTSSSNWFSTCPITQSFTVIHPDSITKAPSFGFISTRPCPAVDASIHAPFLRPGFSDQNIYVQACNDNSGTAILDSAYVIIELDTLLILQSSPVAYSTLGNNLYKFDIGSIYPGECKTFNLSCSLSVDAVLGQSLCMRTELFPTDSCYLNTTPSLSPSNTSPCSTTYDFSHLEIYSQCDNDTLLFIIQNKGVGDMSCFSQVRLYKDGNLTVVDSIQLVSNDTAMFTILSEGYTYRMEVDQHPLHIGNSNPSNTVELCGDINNWTSDLVNILPHDDADPQVDIYCGLVRGSYDPNDKTGYPLGVGVINNIEPNQDIEYLIRFQNTGTDTAFTIVIRDTLSPDLDIFSVRSGVSSDKYHFRMYGERVLEWTFNNIMLPDSNVNEPASHGFVKFKVKQVPNLPLGTVIENSAAIYFDFNLPIITNTSWHTINLDLSVATDYILEEQLQVKVYPNPTTGVICVDKNDNSEIVIQVVDNLGRLLILKKTRAQVTNIDLSKFPTSIYFILVNNGEKSMVQKIVKQ